MSFTYRLDGQVALVTGASRGNGLRTAEKLARAGANVYLAAHEPPALIEAAAAKCRSSNPDVRIESGRFDFTTMEAPADMVNAALEVFGRVDVLVNNAVTRSYHPFGEFSGSEFDEMMAVNVRAAFVASQEVLPAMRRQGGGRIIHVASQLGIVAYPKMLLYGLTKSALIYLGRAMAYELAKENIIVNTISPGVIMSDINVERVKENPGLVAERCVDIPAGRFGDPDEIAEAILYLAAGAPPYLQGHNLVVDGGYISH